MAAAVVVTATVIITSVVVAAIIAGVTERGEKAISEKIRSLL